MLESIIYIAFCFATRRCGVERRVAVLLITGPSRRVECRGT
jgi:hypothetical protein